MFNYNISIKRNYLLVGGYKCGLIYTGSYSKNDNQESITSHTTGEIFYSINDFLVSIYGIGTDCELMSLIIYDEKMKYWMPLQQLIV